MISGSVAVEGGARALPPPFPAAEFLRPLPRAPPYARQAPAPAPEEAPSAAPAYPPVPGAYRFLPHFYGGYGAAYHQLQGQHHQQQQQHHQQHLQQHQQHHQHHQPQHQAQHLPQPVALPPPPSPPSRPAPRGKEGSLKHRLLSRERPAPAAGRFSRGALIQLDGGQLRRVEDMRTEDFVLSAERSAELRLADSTVVRLLRRPATDTVTLTLSYNRNRAQVDMESPVEHPFFVYGQGWASCSPERTLQCYGLQVNRLQVGDVCVSLMPRETPLPPPPAPLPHSHTVVTTATTTAMTVRPAEAPQRYPENLSLREDRKRRSSAPDICPEDNNKCPRTLLRH